MRKIDLGSSRILFDDGLRAVSVAVEAQKQLTELPRGKE